MSTQLELRPPLELAVLEATPRPPSDSYSQRFRGTDSLAWAFELVLTGDPCSYCGQFTPGARMQPDHIDPWAGGGTHGYMNLTAACRECNSAKCSTPLLMFLLTSRRLRRLAQMELFA